MINATKNIITRAIVGGTAALILYSGLPEALVVRAFDKVHVLKAEYSERFGTQIIKSEEKEQVDQDMTELHNYSVDLDNKLRTIYENQKDLIKQIDYNKRRANLYKNQLKEKIEELEVQQKNSLESRVQIEKPIVIEKFKKSLKKNPKYSVDDVFSW